MRRRRRPITRITQREENKATNSKNNTREQPTKQTT